MTTAEPPDDLDLDTAATALAGLRSMLAADGYNMSLRAVAPDVLGIEITPGPGACSECLVPKEYMAAIAADALGQAAMVGRIEVWRIEVSYPPEGSH